MTRNPYDIRRNEPSTKYNRHMVVQLRFDRESFDALKDLLREASAPKNIDRGGENIHARIFRESVKRVFDQIRNTEYSDG